MKIRAIILSALILCGISAVIMYSRAAQPQQRSSVITQEYPYGDQESYP